MTAVEARDLFRLYATAQGTAVALQGLTLEVAQRELVVVFGPSGSGKTTLLRILAGIDRPSAGTVSVFDHDLRTLRGRGLFEYRARTLGYADQHYARALAPELTARQLVALRLALLGVDRGERERSADALLERVGLLDRAGARPHELSGGEQQRVAVAAALAHAPKLFIADEPTGELDAANAAEVYALIGELARDAGATTIVVSHDPRSAAIADRVVQIRDGRVSTENDRAVVNAGGWIRVPELEDAGRVELVRRDDTISIRVEEPPAPLRAPAPAAGGEVVVAAKAVTKRYGAATVLSDLSLEFRAGRLSVVTGRSGSGKSTLLHLLAGLDTPTAGEVDVLGHALSGLDEDARALLRRDRLGVVAQGSDLVPFLTALETVELALAFRGKPTAGACDALAAVGLAELAHQRVSRLSMGERQRVAIARALAAQPAVLLADEPTARLDEANARAVGVLFAELAATTGAAVICATHDPALVEHAADEANLAASA
ncbi:MAG TPA: ATP-binding cassette domain-containing protein [Gaiellaceae bacterium]|nr:ATP-binding cassette domain-containing protein [Gaiellaceae bacterium]